MKCIQINHNVNHKKMIFYKYSFMKNEKNLKKRIT